MRAQNYIEKLLDKIQYLTFLILQRGLLLNECEKISTICDMIRISTRVLDDSIYIHLTDIKKNLKQRLYNIHYGDRFYDIHVDTEITADRNSENYAIRILNNSIDHLKLVVSNVSPVNTNQITFFT